VSASSNVTAIPKKFFFVSQSELRHRWSGWRKFQASSFLIKISLSSSGDWLNCRVFIQGRSFNKPTRCDGRVVVVTGGNTGIGKETAVELAKR
jgi:hypothetical protein